MELKIGNLDARLVYHAQIYQHKEFDGQLDSLAVEVSTHMDVVNEEGDLDLLYLDLRVATSDY